MNEAAAPHLLSDPGFFDVVRSAAPFDTLAADLVQSLCASMTRVAVPAGSILFEAGDRADALYVVMRGHLSASNAQTVEIGPGQLLGEMQILTGGRHAATVRASTNCELARLAKADLERLAQGSPQLVLALGQSIRRRLGQEQLAGVLKDVFGDLDEASLRSIENELEWVELRPGEALFQQDEASDCMYFVVSGRLIGMRESGKGRRVVAEIGRGESIGEMGFFTGEPRSLAIYARRTSHLVRFMKPVFDRISNEHPRAMLYITELLIKRLRRAAGYVRETFERSNIVVLPLGEGVRTTEFTERLVESLRLHGDAL